MKKPRNAESRKSFIVTESGIVETDEAPKPTTKLKRDPISHHSRSSIPEIDTRPNTGSGLGNEEKQAQKPKPLKFNLDDVKSKLNNKRAEEEEEEKEKRMREKIQNMSSRGDLDDRNASFSGKKKEAIMTQFLVSKAVILMSTERRKRRENAPSGNLGSLMALSKFKSRVEKRRQSQTVLVESSGVVNSQVLIGLGKFKKVVLKKRTSIDEKAPEPEKMR